MPVFKTQLVEKLIMWASMHVYNDLSDNSGENCCLSQNFASNIKRI